MPTTRSAGRSDHVLLRKRRRSALRCGGLLAAALAGLAVPVPARAQTFQETMAFSGLNNPVAIEFSPDGRVFVAEKSGLIKVFDNLSDTTPTIFADLRTNVRAASTTPGTGTTPRARTGSATSSRRSRRSAASCSRRAGTSSTAGGSRR